MKALVTGATGFIGGAVARALLEEGVSIRAMVRGQRALNVAGGEIEVVQGDLRDAAAVCRAVEGCQVIFHVAALYTFWAKPQEIYEVNVAGTRNVLQAALETGVERVVHTSSVATVAAPAKGEVSDETSYPPPEELVGPYKRSKWEAEQVAREFHQRGLPVVIVNPTAPMGEGDVKPTPTGRVVLDFLRGRLPAYVDTGLNVVDVADVAQGHLLAWRKGVPGERYLLGHRNMSLRAVLEALAQITGKRPPRLRIPLGVMLPLAYADRWVEGWLLRRKPVIPLEGVQHARRPIYVDCSKAVRELGLPQTPVEQALGKAVCWYQDNGYVVLPGRVAA